MSALREGDQISESRSAGEIVQDWLAEEDTQRRLQACIKSTIQKLEHDLDLLVPRSQNDRSGGFAAWLSFWRERLGPAMQEEFDRQFSEFQSLLPSDYISQLIRDQVWPQVEHFLLTFAVLGLTRAWVTWNLGDAVVLCEPERQSDKWIVPLRLRGRGGEIGNVVLDKDGNIDEGRSLSRAQALAQVGSGG